MPTFALGHDLRAQLWQSGYGGVDCAIRFAAVELELWLLGPQLHWDAASDGEQRHYSQFLAWTDAAVVGIDRGVRQIGDHALLQQWRLLGKHALRKEFRDMRHRALKEQADQAPWQPTRIDEQSIVLAHALTGFGPGVPAYGTSRDYLDWIRDAALPLLIAAVEKGSIGPLEIDPSLRVSAQMPFPSSDPWTPRDDPELAARLEG